MANVPARVVELIETFERNIEAYRSPEYKETRIRPFDKFAGAKVPAKKTRIQRQINTTDNQIDKLVYELYGLTDEEIEIIEETRLSK